jgi:hypothetical protein
MRIIYMESETILKIAVASIKTSLKKFDQPKARNRESKIKNQKSKNDEQ